MARILICKSKREAKDMLKTIKRFIKRDRYVTVVEVYGINKIEANFSDYYEGWTTMKQAKIVRNENNRSYTILLPPTEELSDIIISLF